MAAWPVILTLALVGLLLLFAWRLVRRPRLEIGERGIRDRGLGWIPWDEIEGAYPPEGGAQTVRLRLRVTERLAGILRSRRVELGQDDLYPGTVVVPLDLTDTDVDAVDVLQEIMGRQRAATPVPADLPGDRQGTGSPVA